MIPGDAARAPSTRQAEAGAPGVRPAAGLRSVSILIPAYNEAAAIGAVVEGAGRHARVVVVDDGSDDGTAEEAARAGAEVVRHPRRRGKSAALRTGIAAVRAHGATHVVTLDGDGQHDARDVPALLTAAAETPAAIIVGGRLRDARPLPAGRLNALRVAGFFVEWASGLGLLDTQSGFRVYPLALFDGLRVEGEGFVFETAVLIAAARRGWPAREVPVSVIPRACRPSRFRAVADGIAIGVYLAGPVGRRFAEEATAACRALARARRRSAGGERRAASGLGDRARWRRAALAASAAGASPVLLALAAARALLGDRLPDVVTPLVDRLYSAERLVAGALRARPAGADVPPLAATPGAHP
jgi:hypothetical protein